MNKQKETHLESNKGNQSKPSQLNKLKPKSLKIKKRLIKLDTIKNFNKYSGINMKNSDYFDEEEEENLFNDEKDLETKKSL